MTKDRVLLVITVLLFGIVAVFNWIMVRSIKEPPQAQAVERIVTVEKIIEVPAYKEEPIAVNNPAPPKTFQTFLFTVQVSMDKRHDADYAKKQMKKLCATLKMVAGVQSAVPVKIYGVYLDGEEAHCEPLYR